MKFTVLTACDAAYKPLQDLTLPTVEEYAHIHGYDLCVRLIEEKERPPAWYKLIYTLDCFDAGADFVLWVDTDALIVNKTRKLESLVCHDKDFYYSRMLGMPNTGAYLIRNNQASRDFFQLAWNQVQFMHHKWWEQQAIIHIINRQWYPLEKLQEVPAFFLNTDVYSMGCFVYHMLGISNYDRMKWAKHYRGIK
jgi:hypothetical protein